MLQGLLVVPVPSRDDQGISERRDFEAREHLIERANQKEAAMGGKLDEERKRRREEHQREQEELALVNARWEKL